MVSLFFPVPIRGEIAIDREEQGNSGASHGVAAARSHAQNRARSGMLASFLMLSLFLSAPRPWNPTPRQSGDTFLPFLMDFMRRVGSRQGFSS